MGDDRAAAVKWRPAEIEIVRNLFHRAEWPVILAALPGRSMSAIRQFARALGVNREVNRRRRWSKAEISTLWRLYPSADAAEIELALPGRGTIATIQKTASTLGIKRQTPGIRANKRWVHPLVRQLRAEREKLKMPRKTLSQKSGYHVNQILGWELGKANPDLRFICELAEALGFELILRKKMTGDIIPWPARDRLMARR